jgi:O-antigen/teichoic acid export membrane protein
VTGRTKKAIWGFGSDVGGLIAFTIISFIAAPILLELTSETLYGFWLTIISILGYLALTDLGLGLSLTRFVAELASKGDSKALNGIINTAFFTFCVVGVIFFIIGISISSYIPSWFKIPQEELLLVISTYRVAIISGALALPLSVFSGIVVGFQQMAVINISKNIISIVSVGLSIILLYLGIGLVALPIASLFIVVVGSIVSFFYAKKYFPGLKLSISAFNRADLKKLLSFGGYFQLGRVSNTVALSSDNIVIAGYMGAENVTPYSFTSKLPVMFSVALASKLPNAIFPAMTEMFANNEIDNLRQIYKRLVFFSVRFALFGGALMVIANPQFVKLWVGPENYGGELLNFIFVLWVIFDTIYRGTTAIVFASGDLKNWTIAASFEAVLNIAISLTLVGPLGLVGVALGTLISKLMTTGFYTPYWVCRKLNMSIKYLIKKSIIKPVVRSLPSILITYIFAQYLPLNLGWLWLILVGLVLTITNLFMFELISMYKSSNESWKSKLRKLILMQEEY